MIITQHGADWATVPGKIITKKGRRRKNLTVFDTGAKEQHQLLTKRHERITPPRLAH